ncbi:phospholipase D-like domain-containing protein [Microcoleus sp. S13C4]|uniref:phospholipase D-like domain-containing protein n=1 Tax=Microcoleus sp. S13C4 TaxID=3055410 RepID=UPI002FD23085
MRKPPYYYLRNISRRWHTEIKKVDDKVIILSPYLTSKTAEAILKGSNYTECEVYTIFSVRNFVSGASSLKTLKTLHQCGCKLYHLPRLHAKIIIAPGRFATIGSQNLTRNGVKNKEASVITFDKEEVKKIEEMLGRWLIECKPITTEMMNELEAKITALRKKFSLINRELNKEISTLEDDLWSNEDERIENKLLAEEAEKQRQLEEQRQLEVQKRQEEQRQLEVQKRQEEQRQLEAQRRQEEQRRTVINVSRTRLQQLLVQGEVELELAKEFIRESAYWDHPSGSLVRARKHAERIYDTYRNNWVIDFGGNSFLVGAAIYRCQQALLEFLERAECRDVMPILQLREQLELIVRGAVSNHAGDEYNGYYPVDDNFMRFGTQAINIYDFVNLIFSKAGIDDSLFDSDREN